MFHSPRIGRTVGARAAVVLLLATLMIGLVPSPPAARADDGHACTYDICDVVINGSWGAVWESRTLSDEVWWGDRTEYSRFNFQDVGDGSGAVYIRDARDRCVSADGDDMVRSAPCTGDADQRWYFQNSDDNNFVLRRVSDDRCTEMHRRTWPPRSELEMHSCRATDVWRQHLSFEGYDKSRTPEIVGEVQARATRYAAKQCEEAKNVTCSYLPGATSAPALTAPEAIGVPAHNFTQTPVPTTIRVSESKSATTSFGYSYKYSVKFSAGIEGFAKTEWAFEQAWSVGKAWTDTTALSQSVTAMVPANGVAWIAYAQLTRTVNGTISFSVKDTNMKWSDATSVTLPAKDSGTDRSHLFVCDDRSTAKICLDSNPLARVDDRARSGAKVASTEWLTTVTDGDHVCTGTAVAESWVLTAKQCGAQSVHYTTKAATGLDVRVDKIVDSPTGGVRLLHLSTAVPLTSYPALDTTSAFSAGQPVQMYSAGSPADPVAVVVDGATDSVQKDELGGGDLVMVKTAAGRAVVSDLGAPLLRDGRIVGVLNVSKDNGAGTLSGYASVRTSAAALSAALTPKPTPTPTPTPTPAPSSTPDPAVHVKDLSVVDGVMSLTMSRELFESPTRMMIWADDKYVGETYAGHSAYVSVRRNDDGTVTVSARVDKDAVVRVGSHAGVPGYGATLKTTKVVRAAMNGVSPQFRLLAAGSVEMTLPAAAVAAPRRLMVFVNDRYVGETYQGRVFYLGSRGDGKTTVLSGGSGFRSGDRVELRLATGYPGQSSSDAVVLSRAVL